MPTSSRIWKWHAVRSAELSLIRKLNRPIFGIPALCSGSSGSPDFCWPSEAGYCFACCFFRPTALGGAWQSGAQFTLGGLLGYGIRAPIWWSIILALAALTVIVTMLIMASLAGLFCGVILVLLFFVPTFFGLAVGRLLRAALKESTFSQRWYLPVVAFLLLPGVVHAAEKIIGFSHPPETVETSAVLPVNLHRAWSCHLFGRDTRPDAAAAMKLGLPRPTTMPNEHFLLGTEQKIKFNKGELTIRVTQRVEDSLLGFDYIRQSHVEDRAVRLPGWTVEVRSGRAGTNCASPSVRATSH